jgi:hypothetical protein
VRPRTLAEVVVEAVRLAGEVPLEILRDPYGCSVRTAAGWRALPGYPMGGDVEVSIAGARPIELRCYEVWYEAFEEDYEGDL